MLPTNAFIPRPERLSASAVESNGAAFWRSYVSGPGYQSVSRALIEVPREKICSFETLIKLAGGT